jgi:hypothetical protein
MEFRFWLLQTGMMLRVYLERTTYYLSYTSLENTGCTGNARKNSKILSLIPRPSSQTSYHKMTDIINVGAICTNRGVCILKAVVICSLIKLKFPKVSIVQYYPPSYARYINPTL